MNIRHAKALAAAVSALALLAAACGAGDGDSPAPTALPDQQPEPATDPDPQPVDDPVAPPVEEPPAEQEPVEEPASEQELVENPPAEAERPAEQEPAGPPHVAELAWGNFELAERIAGKLAAGDPLNFVVSLMATARPGPVESFEYGWSLAGAEVAEQRGVEVNTRVVGPNSADIEAQAATIEALVASGDIDCLAVDAADPRLLAPAIDAAVDAGVPVFAVGGDSPDSKRFAFYGIDALAAGEAAGRLVGEWAVEGGILVRRAGVLTGDAGDQRSFDLMRGFVAGLSEIHSGLEWVNGPVDADSFGFDPFDVYDRTEAWVLENIDADIVFHTDSGLEALSGVMADQLLYGDMYAVGFHISEPVTDYIRERLVVATMVQGLTEQAYLAGLACGDFLLSGAYDTGHVVVAPVAVTRDNIDELDWTLPENQ